MVLYEEPVAHVLALAIDREGLALTDVIDEQGYQLLGELIGPIVIGAVGHDGGHAIGIVIGTNEVVARSLAGRIGRVGIVLRSLVEEVVAVSQMMFT